MFGRAVGDPFILNGCRPLEKLTLEGCFNSVTDVDRKIVYPGH